MTAISTTAAAAETAGMITNKMKSNEIKRNKSKFAFNTFRVDKSFQPLLLTVLNKRESVNCAQTLKRTYVRSNE